MFLQVFQHRLVSLSQDMSANLKNAATVVAHMVSRQSISIIRGHQRRFIHLLGTDVVDNHVRVRSSFKVLAGSLI